MNDGPVTLSGAAHAFALGIGMVHQEFMLVAGLTFSKTSCWPANR